jgi:hypothetical protein
MLIGGVFWGCSDKKEPATEKGAIKKMTEETAREAVNQIRAPIGKARSVAKQQGDKANEMDDTLKSGLELMLVFPCEREGKQFS